MFSLLRQRYVLVETARFRDQQITDVTVLFVYFWFMAVATDYITIEANSRPFNEQVSLHL